MKNNITPAQKMLMRRLINHEPASVHNGLVYIYNICNQGVVAGHTKQDVIDLYNHGYIKLFQCITSNPKYSMQKILVTKWGGWVFRKRIFGWDGWIKWTPCLDWGMKHKIQFRLFGIRISFWLVPDFPFNPLIPYNPNPPSPQSPIPALN